MITTTHLGCPGHFICASDCHWKRHTQVGTHFRVSSVGDLWLQGVRRTVGAKDDAWYETMVFETRDEPASLNGECGCLMVTSWSELEGVRYATAGEAQRGHDALVRKYRRLARKMRP